jgi:hypothetical protein
VRRLLAAAPLLALIACSAPDPRQALEVSEVEAYWAIDSAAGDQTYIAPALRFRVKNVSAEPLRTVQATATFRRKGEEHLDWGTAWEGVTPSGKPLAPGASRVVLLKSDARYHSSGPAEAFFAHPEWKDAVAKLYLRAASSPWVLFAETTAERHIGTRSLPPDRP